MNRRLRYGFIFVLATVATLSLQAQNIQSHFVSRAQEDGTIYHTFPQTLFASKQYGDLSYDLTYKEHKTGLVTMNFSYEMPSLVAADSVCIRVNQRRLMSGKVEKIYIEPAKKMWTHRYSFAAPIDAYYRFYNAEALPQLTIYSNGKAYEYVAKKSAWNSYAPIGDKIFKMIRVNEEH